MSGRNRGGRNTTGDKPNTGEITPELKKKIDNVEKVAPGWSKEDIIRLLERVNFNDQIAINDILDGVARPPQEWNEVVSKKTKAETKSKNQPQQQRGYRDGNRNQRSNTAPTQRFNRRDGEEGGERSDRGGERRNDRGERNDRGDRNDRRGPRNNRQNNSDTGTTSTDAGAQANSQNTNVPSQGSVIPDGTSIVTPLTQTTTPVSTVPTSQVPITGYKPQPQQSWASKAQSSMTPPVQRPQPSSAAKHTESSSLSKATHSPTTPIPTINPPIVPLMPVSPITPIHTDTTHPEPIAKPNTTTPQTTTTTTAAVGSNTRSTTYQPHKHNNNWRNKEARNQDTALEPVPSTAAIAAPTRTAPVTTAVTAPVTAAVPPTAAAAGNAHASFVASVTQPAVRLPSNLAAMTLYDNEVQFGTVQVPASISYNKKVTTPVTAPTTQTQIPHTTTTTTQMPHTTTHLAPSAPHLSEGSEDAYGQSEESYPKMEEHIMHNPQFSYAGHHGYPMFPGAYFPPESEGRMPGMYEQFYGAATHETASDSKYPATTPGFSSFPRDSVKFTGETSPQGQTNPGYYGSPMYYPHYPNAFQQFGNPNAYYRAPYFPQGNYRGYPGAPYNQTPPGYPDELTGAFPDKGGYNPQTFDNTPSSAAPSQQGSSQKLQSMPTSSKTYGAQQGGVENRDGGHVKNPMAPYNYNYLQSYPNANYSYPQGTGTYPSARQGSSNF